MTTLTFDEYAAKAAGTATYPRDAAVVYPVLGLLGETGELAEKILAAVFPDGKPEGWGEHDLFLRSVYNTIDAAVRAAKGCEALKKLVRDQTDKLPTGVLDEIAARVLAVAPTSMQPILKELGDCQWYSSAVCRDLGVGMGDVAQTNLDKLASRKARGTLSGSGDNR